MVGAWEAGKDNDTGGDRRRRERENSMGKGIWGEGEEMPPHSPCEFPTAKLDLVWQCTTGPQFCQVEAAIGREVGKTDKGHIKIGQLA